MRAVHYSMTNTIEALIRTLCLTACVAAAAPAGADSYTVPAAGSDVVGEVQMDAAGARDTLLDIARRHGLGYEEITNANPGVDTWLPGAGTSVVLPKRLVAKRSASRRRVRVSTNRLVASILSHKRIAPWSSLAARVSASMAVFAIT